MDARSVMFTPSGLEYETFPPVVKKKYFSPLERLRYAHDMTLPPAGPMTQARPKSRGTSRQRTAHHFHIRPPTRQAKELPREVTGRDISHEEAFWYHSLPEKIKRNHFTFEERHLYRIDKETVPDPTKDLFYKLSGRQANRSLPSLSSTSDQASEPDSVLDDNDVGTPMDMNDAILDSFKLLEAGSPLDLSFDEYHTHLADTANVARTLQQKDPPPRNRSFTAVSTSRPRPSLDMGKSMVAAKNVACQSASISPDSALPALPSSVRRSASTSLMSTKPSSRARSHRRPSLLERRASKKSPFQHNVPSVPAIDPKAAHVSDPAARLKLKLYLSSAAKFDEAVEFGFPSLEKHVATKSTFSMRRSSTDQHASQRGMLARPLKQTQRESTDIGITFFFDDDDDDDKDDDKNYGDTQADRESDATAVESDSPSYAVELPVEPVTPTSRHSLSYSPAPIGSAPVTPQISAFPSVSDHIDRSYAIQLKPRRNTSQSITAIPLMPSALPGSTQLKPWIDPIDQPGEREMTLRLTLTRKDLRADEKLIYPEESAVARDAFEADEAVRERDRKWRFWQRRR